MRAGKGQEDIIQQQVGGRRVIRDRSIVKVVHSGS